MSLIDLSNVTRTLITLLETNINTQIDSSASVTVTVEPPDRVNGATNTLGLHLYHVTEDPYYKNLPGPGSDIPNIATAPMGLCLYYILTAHHATSEPQFDSLTQQRLMGYALKTLHDFSVITDDTQIDSTPILHGNLIGQDNDLQIIMRPVAPEDALSFWHSEDSQTARLSAYYEVRIVLLEPEPPTRMPGIVLHVGTFIHAIGTPHIDCSQNTIRFTLPALNGGSLQVVEATPARVTLDTTPLQPDPPNNQFLLLGANLAAGSSRSLVLRNEIWERLPAPAGPVDESILDLAHNEPLGWRAEFRTDRVVVEIAPTLRHERPDGTLVDLPVLPGFYTAFVRAVMVEKIIANEPKQIVATSNRTVIAIAARIEGHDAPDASGDIQINLGPEFDPLDANLPDDAIQVTIAGTVYTRVNTDPPPNPGEFVVGNAPGNFIRIRPHFPVVVTEAVAHPFRLLVNGVDSAPFWIELG